MAKSKKGKKETNGKRASHGSHDHGSHHHGSRDHKPHDPPYFVPDEEHEHGHEPPDNPRYPDPRIFGDYASRKPPHYVPHPFEQTCFKPRKEDYKPPATCDDHDGELCVRKDHRRMTADEQNRFLNAFTQINAMNAFGPMVDIHANAIHQMHSTQRFLPWHRVYLLRMEELLMMVDPTVCIPYWKSSEEQAFPAWLQGFTPTVNLLGGPHTVHRNSGLFTLLPTAADVAAAMTNATFTPFTSALQGIHNSGHVWVGGTMSSVTTAPADPVFWMHHAEIDRIWAEWQEANPGQNPALAGAAAIMDPWAETEVDTRDITALGYDYV